MTMSSIRSLSHVFRLGQIFHRLTLADSLPNLSYRCVATHGVGDSRIPVSSHFRSSQRGQDITNIYLPQISQQETLLNNHLTASLKQSLTTNCNHVGKEYVCPSRLSFNKPPVVILDMSISGQGVVDCPTLPQTLRDVIAPEGRIDIISDPKYHDQPAKEAANILKIRRRKMNRHLLKKFRKRMLFTLRKQKQQQRKKKKLIFNAEMNAIRKKAADFDAEQHIRNELEEARRGGFYINILDSKKS